MIPSVHLFGLINQELSQFAQINCLKGIQQLLNKKKQLKNNAFVGRV